MKLQISVVLIFLMVHSTQSYGQYENSKAQVNISQGENAAIPQFRMEGPIGSDESGVYLFGELKDKPHLVKFGPDLTYQLDVPLALDLNPSRILEIVKYLLKEGRLFIFYEEQDRNNFKKTFELYMQEYDVNTLQKEGKPVRLCMNRASKARYSLDSEMKYFFPKDHSEFVVAYQETLDGENNQITFDVFDYRGKKLHSLETLPEMNRMGHVMDVKINSEGKIYLAYGYKFLYIFDRNGKLHNAIDMELPEMLLANRGELLMDDEENKYLSYLNFNKDSDRVIGFINQKIDKNQNTETFIVSLSHDYVTLNQDRKSIKSSEQDLSTFGQPGLTNLRLLKKKGWADGSLMLVYEKFTRVKVSYKDKTGYYYEDTYGDLHVIKFNPSGELDWMQKIPKLQTKDVGDRLTSAYVHWTNDETFIFMSDNPANNKDMAVEVPVPYDKNSKDVTLVHINADGQVSRNALFSKDDKPELFPRCKWMMETDGHLIMPMIGSKYVQLIRFDFK